MTNPARPEFQDIIDEAWGDQVADHVIRRYPDTATRDADLPAPEVGQVVAITGGAAPRLQVRTATGWLDFTTTRARMMGTPTVGVYPPDPSIPLIEAVGRTNDVPDANSYINVNISGLGFVYGYFATATATSEYGLINPDFAVFVDTKQSDLTKIGIHCVNLTDGGYVQGRFVGVTVWLVGA